MPCRGRCSAWPATRRGAGCLEQVVLGAVAVAGDPRQVSALRDGEFLARLGHPLHPLGGEEAGLDPLGQFDLLLGVEEGDLADLLEVGADRVGGGGELGVLARLAQRLGLVLVPDEVAGLLVLLGGLLDLLGVGLGRAGDLRGGLSVGVVAVDLVDHDLLVGPDASGRRCRRSTPATRRPRRYRPRGRRLRGRLARCLLRRGLRGCLLGGCLLRRRLARCLLRGRARCGHLGGVVCRGVLLAGCGGCHVRPFETSSWGRNTEAVLGGAGVLGGRHAGRPESL